MPETQETPTIEQKDTIQDTKEQLADKYLTFLDQQKGGVLATSSGLGVNLNPFKKNAKEYLLAEGADKKKDVFSKMRESIKKKFVEKMSSGTLLEYNKASLNKMKALITQYKDDQIKLQELMAQIDAGTDPTLTEKELTQKDPNVVDGATAIVATGALAVESAEKMSDRRKAVVTNIHAVLKQDKKHRINYNRGGKTSIEKGLDCSGLINYTVNHAGLSIGGDSRTMFKEFSTSKLELANDKSISSDISKFEKGDVLYFNNTQEGFSRGGKLGKVPVIKKDGKEYRIHHVAFIKSIDKEKGTVEVVESNGAQGVTESTINVYERSKKNDELYVAHVDYDKLKRLDQTTLAKLETLPGASIAA